MKCPECGSIETQKYGVRRNRKGFYQRWKCTNCGAVSKEENPLETALLRQGESTDEAKLRKDQK